VEREEILKIARERFEEFEPGQFMATDDDLVLLASAIAAHEREESATVCDNRGCDCGELIRARGNK